MNTPQRALRKIVSLVLSWSLCLLPIDGNAAGATMWAKSFGGAGADIGHTMAVDPQGNIIVAGLFSGTVDFGVGPLTSAGGNDIFLMKVTPSGVILWARSYGSTGDETAGRILLDAAGNIFLAGGFAGSGNFGGTTTTALGANGDAYLAKYTAQGAYRWSRTLDAAGTSGPGGLAINGMAFDSQQQNVIVTGSFQGSTALTPTATFKSQNGGRDSYLAQYSAADGSPIWAKTFSSGDYDVGWSVFVDRNNNILVAGVFAFQIDLGSGVLAADLGTRDFYIAKFAAAGAAAPGAALWSKKYGAVNNNTLYCAALDKNGDLVVGGFFPWQTDLGSGVISGTGDFSGFLAKYNGANGGHVWSRAIQSNRQLIPYGISLDATNNPIVTGAYMGTFNFGAQSFTAVGSSQDIFVAKFDGTSGAPLWAKSFGGVDTDGGAAITVDRGNRLYLLGYFSGSANLDGNSFTSAGATDIFLLKLNP